MQHYLVHVPGILAIDAQQIGRGVAPLVVQAPHPFVAGVWRLGRRLRDLDGRRPFVVLAHGHQLVDAVQGRVAPRGNEVGAHAIRQAADHLVRVQPVAERLFPDLGQDLQDNHLVQVAREHDGGVRKPGIAEHARRLDGQVGQVARIQADAYRLVSLFAQILKDTDGVRHATFQRIDGIHQQQAVVGVNVGVGLECVQLGHAQGHEGLDHAVGMRALGWHAHHVGQAGVRGKVRPADEGRPRPGVGSPSLCPPQAKLQQQLATAAVAHPCRLCGNQRLVVEVVEQRRLQDLGHGQWPLHHGDRHVGMHHPSLRDGAQADVIERAVVLQPGQKVVAKKPVAGLAPLAAQMCNVLVADMCLLHPVQQPLQPGVDAVARLVAAIVRVFPEKMIELGITFVQAITIVELGHRKLVLVGVKDAFRSMALARFHLAPPFGLPGHGEVCVPLWAGGYLAAARSARSRSTVSKAWRRWGMTMLPPTTRATFSASYSASSLSPISTHCMR